MLFVPFMLFVRKSGRAPWKEGLGAENSGSGPAFCLQLLGPKLEGFSRADFGPSSALGELESCPLWLSIGEGMETGVYGSKLPPIPGMGC